MLAATFQNHFMQTNKRLRNLLLFVLGFLIVSVIFFYLTIIYSKPTTAFENTTDGDKAKQQDFNNCILLRKDKATLVLARVETNISYVNIGNELPDKLKGLNNLNIIYAKDADYNSVVKVLNAVAAAGMQNYKLLKM